MVAGGSGITPMFQVALAILRSQQDGTTVHLVYANVAEGDILLRQHLDAWARVHADRFKARARPLLRRAWVLPMRVPPHPAWDVIPFQCLMRA